MRGRPQIHVSGYFRQKETGIESDKMIRKLAVGKFP